MVQNLQYKFLDWKGPPSVGTFPKNHPFWYRHSSLCLSVFVFICNLPFLFLYFFPAPSRKKRGWFGMQGACDEECPWGISRLAGHTSPRIPAEEGNSQSCEMWTTAQGTQGTHGLQVTKGPQGPQITQVNLGTHGCMDHREHKVHKKQKYKDKPCFLFALSTCCVVFSPTYLCFWCVSPLTCLRFPCVCFLRLHHSDLVRGNSNSAGTAGYCCLGFNASFHKKTEESANSVPSVNQCLQF